MDTTTTSRANVFINWINDKLKPVNLEIKDIKKFDGVIAKELIQVLTQKKLVPPDINIITFLLVHDHEDYGEFLNILSSNNGPLLQARFSNQKCIV